MSPSPKSFLTALTRGSGQAVFLLSVLTVLVLSAFLSGCGGGQDEEDVVLATVGKTDVMASYFEGRLIKLKETELPRAADGSPADMSLPEGKKKFLETLINKEVMVQTAERMGLQNDPGIVGARDAMMAYEADLVMWDRVIRKPSETISEEELLAFYEKLGTSRDCLFVICNFIDDANAAREMALTGADWEDVANKFHDGGDPPGGRFEISVPFGRYSPDYENGVFNTEIGGVTPPIRTVYGFWVLKVIKENAGEKPTMDEAQAQILDVTWNRKMSHLKDDFKKGVLEKFQLTIHDDALWKCYLALPEGETLFQEGTKTPRTPDELLPLNIATEDLDLPFYSYLSRDGIKEYTLLDYKIHFDKMSVFQRPKDTDMLGGLRNKIEAELAKTLLTYEAEDRGLMEDPEVLVKVKVRVEEMIVNKLYQEVVTIDDRITPEDLNAFWAEKSQDYIAREKRAGRLVICQNAELAAEAHAMIKPEVDWKDILVEYGTDKDNKSRSGKLVGIIQTPGNLFSTAMFALQPGEVSEPFAIDDGRFGIVRLDSVTPQEQLELEVVREDVGARMRNIRKEEAFQTLLAKWKEDIPVTIFEENLAGLKSWKELTAVELSGTPVPRN